MRLLRRIDVCGREYRVFESTPPKYPDLETAEAVCDNESATIVVFSGLADTVKIDRLLHEILHAVITCSGLVHKLEEACGLDADVLEEDIVTTLTPALRGALKSAGWREPKTIGKSRTRRAT
jgi:hypothetical protein